MGDMADLAIENALMWPDEGIGEDCDDEHECDADDVDRPLVWKTRSGEQIKPSDMTDEHVANALRVVRAWDDSDGRDRWIAALEGEQSRRRNASMDGDPVFAAFKAGWAAAQAYEDHEWGPAPPGDPYSAYARWREREGR